MNKKYIVKNCPVYNPKYCDCKNTKEIACLYRTNCLIKQVIEKCMVCSEGWSDWAIAEQVKASEILELFEIEEVE